MKYLAALLLVILLAVATFATTPMSQAQAPLDTPGMFGHTPVPKGGAAATASGTPGGKAPAAKVPLTASLAKDDKGKSPASVFAPADTVYVIWKDPTATKGDKVRTVWYAEDAGKTFPKNKKLSEYTQTLPGPGAIGTALSPTIKGGLPAGTYRAEVYDGAKLVVKLPFTIK